jgi:predicted RNA binding protein YcfA (HicA-like mRNA interferase family)
MTYTQLTRKLRALGCQFKRQSKGSHEIWHNPLVNRSASIPHHSGDIPEGTLHTILRQLEISREEIEQA